MDFVSEALFDGHRLRLLTVTACYTRECLGSCAGQHLRSEEVAGKMPGKWVYERGELYRPLTPGPPNGQSDAGVVHRQAGAGVPE